MLACERDRVWLCCPALVGESVKSAQLCWRKTGKRGCCEGIFLSDWRKKERESDLRMNVSPEADDEKKNATGDCFRSSRFTSRSEEKGGLLPPLPPFAPLSQRRLMGR